MHFAAVILASVLSAIVTAQSATTTEPPPEVRTITIPGEDPVPTTQRPNTPGGDGGLNITSTFTFKCSGRNMPNDNFASINAAIEYMTQLCAGPESDRVIPSRRGLIIAAAEAQVYWCNYADHELDIHLQCNKDDYAEAAFHIDDVCGQGGGGWVEYMEASRMRYSIGRDPRYLEGTQEPIQECGF